MKIHKWKRFAWLTGPEDLPGISFNTVDDHYRQICGPLYFQIIRGDEGIFSIKSYLRGLLIYCIAMAWGKLNVQSLLCKLNFHSPTIASTDLEYSEYVGVEKKCLSCKAEWTEYQEDRDDL